MIAKIGKGSNLYGAMSYNLLKVEQENGSIIQLQNMYETLNGRYTIVQLLSSFETHLTANRKTEKPVLHISLNPDPNDKVSDEQFRTIAGEYMEKMGYGNQPYVIFKHTDTERTHIHIVSVCVDEDGKKIDDSFEKRRSMAVCRDLEQEQRLIPATEKSKSREIVFRPVDHKGKDIKSQIASVVRYLPKYYQFQTLGTYNALLSLFNITAEQVNGEFHGRPKQGLVYFALNEQGEKASNPFKASRFGQYAGLPVLQEHFEQSKEKMKTSPAKASLKNTIEVAMNISTNEPAFKKLLIKEGINTVIRRNDEGRIYGITFIDHESRNVWNGSQLSRNLSANTFNDLWNDLSIKSNLETEEINRFHQPVVDRNIKTEKEEYHPFFDFLGEGNYDIAFDDFGWISLLPATQGADYEDSAFEKQMKKKKYKKRRGY